MRWSRRHGLANLGIIGRPAVIVIRRGREERHRNDVLAMHAIIVWQLQGEAVHQWKAGDGIERPLLARDARRQAEDPTVIARTISGTVQHLQIIRARRQGKRHDRLHPNSRLGVEAMVSRGEEGCGSWEGCVR
ncbi:hypothetical protein ACQ5SK_21705 [Bradyrhizobium japonicum]